LEAAERDVEVRLAMLVALRENINVGFDARARFDVGKETEDRDAMNLEGKFDLLAGPLVTLALGPVMLMAQPGVHVLATETRTLSGFSALGGVGAAF
jgi:hypothetical protein